MTHHSRRAALLGVVLALGCAHLAAAQPPGPDVKATAAYKLTMPKVKKAAAVVQSVTEESLKDPNVQPLDPGAVMNENKTLAEMEATVRKHPQMMRSLAREGMSARDFSLTVMTLFQAVMVEGFSQGNLDMSKLPPGVNPENIQFVRDHKAELQAMQQTMTSRKK